MGLDMYLTKKTYIGAEYKHRNVKGKIEIEIDGKPISIDFNRINYIDESVGYWRKANHIHQWFVTHCQDGEDDCREASVGKEDLEKLLLDCKTIKKNQNKAEKLMPTKGGFFFGGTDYDEYYFSQIDKTIDIVENLLKENTSKEHLSFEVVYSSSW